MSTVLSTGLVLRRLLLFVRRALLAIVLALVLALRCLFLLVVGRVLLTASLTLRRFLLFVRRPLLATALALVLTLRRFLLSVRRILLGLPVSPLVSRERSLEGRLCGSRGLSLSSGQLSCFLCFAQVLCLPECGTQHNKGSGKVCLLHFEWNIIDDEPVTK